MVIAMNVHAHVPDPSDFLKSIRENVLTWDGKILVQTSQANMVAAGQFDRDYHEHMSFVEMPSSPTYDFSMSSEKARQSFGFAPSRGLKGAIQELLDYFSNSDLSPSGLI